MQIVQQDYMTQILRVSIPGDMRHWGTLTAKVVVRQPNGYELETAGDIVLCGQQAQITIRYPLMDDGSWGQIEGFCKAFEYNMGTYTFTAHLLNDSRPIVSETAELDQDQLYANSWKTRIRTDFPPGFIECAPFRSVCIDHDEIKVTIRLKTNRLRECRIRMDVTNPHGDEPLVEPVVLDLANKQQIIAFRHAGWDRGEYWIRVQVIEAGQAVGPFMVRKFWKESIGPERQAEPPLNLGGSRQYMVDDWLFEQSEGVDFWPVSYRPDPAEPAITMDKPWEYGIMEGRTLTYDEGDGLYKLEYTFSVESYRRQGYAWHSLVEEVKIDPVGLPATWEQFEKETQRPIEIRKPQTQRLSENITANATWPTLPTDSPALAYHKLLWLLIERGEPVQEFNIPPPGLFLCPTAQHPA